MARKYTPLTPEQRAEKVNAAKAKLDARIEELLSPEGWQGFIASRAQLAKYSLRNQLLILAQCKIASDVRSFNAWKKAGRSVRKGEKGLAILAPVIVKDRETEEDKLVNYKVVYVFDISQTDGEPVFHPRRVDAALLTGDAPAELWERAARLIKAEGYSLERGDCDGANGVTYVDRRIVRVRSDVEPAQAVKTLIHELAHIRAGHEWRIGSIPTSRMEVEAESIAMIVCDTAGLDSLPYSVGYVAGWARDIEEVTEAAALVTRTAEKIVADMDLIEIDEAEQD
jgi:antirestriction protein ArdC